MRNHNVIVLHVKKKTIHFIYVKFNVYVYWKLFTRKAKYFGGKYQQSRLSDLTLSYTLFNVDLYILLKLFFVNIIYVLTLALKYLKNT